ncbi:MAG TPA: hypothetical protein VH815_03290 [Acidobacteriota bacterium]
MKNVILILFLMTTALYSSIAIADEKEIPNESGMKDLTSLETLKQDFNIHQNEIRIVTLLSPT